MGAAAKKKNANKTKTVKVAQMLQEHPARRSSRKRKSVVDYSCEAVIPMFEDDEEKAAKEASDNDEERRESDQDEEDYDGNSDDDKSEGEEESEDQPKKLIRPKLPSSNKTTSSKPAQKRATPDTSFNCTHPQGGLTLEYAKTGRSTCRKCLTKIGKGEPRVGMEAWIVGRTCITWQCPKCLLQNLTLEIANGGKVKCKVSQAPFIKGQVKLGIRCHTAKWHYSLEAVGGVLANVVALMRTKDDCDTFRLAIGDIVGHEHLSEKDGLKLTSVLEMVFETLEPQCGSVPGAVKPCTNDTEKQDTTQQTVTKFNDKNQKSRITNQQPKAGGITEVKGRVEWKFAGRSCYGTLLPRMETKTHCFARTHKGNVKTLAKGKSYWLILD